MRLINILLAVLLVCGTAYSESTLDKAKALIGLGITGRAVTATLLVAVNGNNTDGKSISTAFTTIQGALDVASTNVNECTLILIGINTGANHYDIDAADDPTYTGNYILQGTHRTWQKIMNTHASATSILKFTGYVELTDLNFNLGGDGTDPDVNGVIITKGAFRVEHCQFTGEDLGAARTALHFDGATLLKHGIVRDCTFRGDVTYMTGLLIDNTSSSKFLDLDFHFCVTGIQIVGADSDINYFHNLDIGDCNLGIDLDAGNEQHFTNISLHDNTTSIDDDVAGGSACVWNNIIAQLPIRKEPDDFIGITVDPGAGGAWTTTPVVVRAAATSTVPFKIVGIYVEADANENYEVSLATGGVYFDTFQFEGEASGSKTYSSGFTTSTDFVFNEGVEIVAKSRSVSGGNGLVVWLKVQEVF